MPQVEMTEDKNIGYNRFITGYCVILPNGHRIYTSFYPTYKRLRAWHSPHNEEREVMKLFKEAKIVEVQLESSFGLPNEHLLGIHEIYPEFSHAAALACVESERLKTAKTNKELGHGVEAKFLHLDLILVTSFSRTSQPSSDISRTMIEEERTGCTCMICIPAEEVFPPDAFCEEALQRIRTYLRVDPRPVNLYIPFRHTRYRREGPNKRLK
jgi:hypothetical protein